MMVDWGSGGPELGATSKFWIARFETTLLDHKVYKFLPSPFIKCPQHCCFPFSDRSDENEWTHEGGAEDICGRIERQDGRHFRSQIKATLGEVFERRPKTRSGFLGSESGRVIKRRFGRSVPISSPQMDDYRSLEGGCAVEVQETTGVSYPV